MTLLRHDAFTSRHLNSAHKLAFIFATSAASFERIRAFMTDWQHILYQKYGVSDVKKHVLGRYNVMT